MITIIGLGFVGLTTALGFAEKGFKVIGYEIDKEKINKLKKFKIPFHEPFLEEFLVKNLKNKNFVLTDNFDDAVKDSEIIIICVGTPSSDEGKVDLNQVHEVIERIIKSKQFNNFKVLCIKSTVPPSTSQDIIDKFILPKGLRIGIDIGIANNPEFLREGFAWNDFLNPDRVIIGSSDDRTYKLMEAIYKPFKTNVFNLNLNTAEFIKYASNTLLASLISFSNELQIIASSIGGIDISKSFKLLHEDKRWRGNPAGMSKYVYPGCGFGGYCLPKDTLGLINKSLEFKYEPKLLKEVVNVNNYISEYLLDSISKKISIEEKVGILGLSFKPLSDDVRMTPSIKFIQGLINKGYKEIYAHDPISIDNFKRNNNFAINYCDNLEELLGKVKFVILLTAWEDYIKVDYSKYGIEVFDFRFVLK